jgi:hypothetical protein
MIVVEALVEHAAHLPFVEEDEVIECLGLQGEDPAFGVGVRVWGPGREQAYRDTSSSALVARLWDSV